MLYFSFEQIPELYKTLKLAGVKHGDRQKIILATGALTCSQEEAIHLAFCSSQIATGSILTRGRWWERWKSIHGEVVAIDQTKQRVVLPANNDERVVALLQGEVFTNGHIEFRFDMVKIAKVSADEELYLGKPEGKPTCRRILQEALASCAA